MTHDAARACLWGVQLTDVWPSILSIVEPVLSLAPASYLTDLRRAMSEAGVVRAVAQRDTPVLYDWIVKLTALQGVSDHIAISFAERNGNVTWQMIESSLSARPDCPLLHTYWSFADCRYSKSRQSCSRSFHFSMCPLPRHALRKGLLNQNAYSLYLFMRDICDGDFVGWIDDRLARVEQISEAGAFTTSAVLLDPLRHVYGASDKIISMILADLLLGGAPDREHWVSAGAGMIAIDSLVHAFLHRTGILRLLDVEHAYGPACYEVDGCAGVIAGLSSHIDARRFNSEFPSCFPRFVQHAIWSFCAQGGLDICNGNQIDDTRGCNNSLCPAFKHCACLPLSPI